MYRTTNIPYMYLIFFFFFSFLGDISYRLKNCGEKLFNLKKKKKAIHFHSSYIQQTQYCFPKEPRKRGKNEHLLIRFFSHSTSATIHSWCSSIWLFLVMLSKYCCTQVWFVSNTNGIPRICKFNFCGKSPQISIYYPMAFPFNYM